MEAPNQHIILFDGVCNFCNSSVMFIINRDKKNLYKFASIQSKTAHDLFKKHNLPEKYLDSIVLIEGEDIYTRSDAALRIAKNLSGGWSIWYGLIVLPKWFRDWGYGLIAKNRYALFGKKESCELPSPNVREKFIEVDPME